MPHSVFNRETLLDISVNIVPLGILAFFILMFLFNSPWPSSLFISVITLGLHIIPFVLLAILTYVAATYL